MKKRILSTILMAAIMLPMAGCNGSTETSETTTEGAEVTTTTVAEEGTTEATTTVPETEETTTTTEAAVELPKIKDYNLFKNGCLSFDVDEKSYVYNIADNKMYELDTEKYKTEYIIAKDKIAISNDTLFNLETGEIIASKEENGIEILGCNYSSNSTGWGLYSTNYIPVMKTEESFDGNVVSFGIVDTNGNWALPLSSDYEICNTQWIEIFNMYNDFSCGTGSLMDLYMDDIDSSIYDFKNDKMINLTDLNYAYSENVGYYISGDNILLCECIPDETWTTFANPTKYNPVTGELTKLYDGGSFSYSNSGKFFVNSRDGMCLILDDNYNVLDYDLSEYFEDNSRGINVIDATENIIIFSARNPQREEYTIILSIDGNRVTDPIKGRAENAYISGDYAVLIDVNDDSYIINHKTGETKKYTDDTLKIVGCDRETGMILVLCDGFIYLADISDPETLINPFEIAE